MSSSLKPEFSNVFQLVFIVIKKYDKLLDNNSMYILFIQSCIITHVLDPKHMLFFQWFILLCPSSTYVFFIRKTRGNPDDD